ncbi:MAG: UDP-N-acetylmuramoyl-L-alanyl-D-glutamate--2,6-diaminopimelate ligase [Saprospiraceae bacterium]
MKLQPLLSNVFIKQQFGTFDREISNVVFDSRKVELLSLFVAVKGTQVNGHQYIDKAIENGASTIICETLPQDIKATITYIKVMNSAAALGEIAHNYYHHPSRKLQLIGVTGTNGKTTTVTLLHRLFSDLGYKVGLLSTVENRIAQQVIPSTHTTPDAIAINALLNDMVEMGCEYAFMEVSSHAIHQDRIRGLVFKGGIFTNLSHDHLDYHNTFKEYINAKKKFFDDLPEKAFALTNVDDKNGRIIVQNTKANISTYGLKRMADYKAKILDNRIEGLHLTVNDQELYCRLVGVFNGYNLLAVYGVGKLLGFDNLELLTSLSNLTAAEGRFDTVVKNNKVGIVDYAHTPDALENVLDTIQQVAKRTQKIITVVGCGGDRDKAKRPIMAQVACEKSDIVILTSDNPRSETPAAILEDMEKGIPESAIQKVLVISDRKQAIKTACKFAKTGDIILVAGKGHEKYQEIKGEKFPFDDKQTLINELLY